ncbi:MAG: hypothetical protein ABI056_07340 [Caulobacteraceae bacterium]
MAEEADLALNLEVEKFESAVDRIALGDLDIRRRFARDILWLFIAANAFVFLALGTVFWRDGVELAAGPVRAD